MGNTNTTFLLRTDQFAFTNSEIQFIRKYIAKKYPIAMSHFIDNARNFMKDLQTRSPQKMTYEANLYYPESGQRYSVYEILSTDTSDTGCTVQIIPTDTSSRESFSRFKHQQPDGNVKSVFSILNDLPTVGGELYKKAFTRNGLPANFVIPKLLSFIESVKHEALFKTADILLSDNSIRVIFDIGHRDSLSHYVSLLFDFKVTD